jgi:hypothetical protein
MAISLSRIRRLAADVAREEDPALEVFGTTNGEGAAGYAEIIVGSEGDSIEKPRMLIGLSRAGSESEVRDRLRHGLREGLRNRKGAR